MKLSYAQDRVLSRFKFIGENEMYNAGPTNQTLCALERIGLVIFMRKGWVLTDKGRERIKNEKTA